MLFDAFDDSHWTDDRRTDRDLGEVQPPRQQRPLNPDGSVKQQFAWIDLATKPGAV